MALSDELEALAKRHGALSYRNRADTANPAFGFSVAGLSALLAEARRDALEEAAKEFDKRAVLLDGGPAVGWYEPNEPAEIIRNLKEDFQ